MMKVTGQSNVQEGKYYKPKVSTVNKHSTKSPLVTQIIFNFGATKACLFKYV